MEEATNARLACFDRGMADFSSYKTKGTPSGENLTVMQTEITCLTDYVLSESVKYVSQCDLILDQRFLCV